MPRLSLDTPRRVEGMHSQTKGAFQKASAAKVAFVSSVLRRPMLENLFADRAFMDWLRVEWSRRAWLRSVVVRAFTKAERWKFEHTTDTRLKGFFYQCCRDTQFKCRRQAMEVAQEWQVALAPCAATKHMQPTDAERLFVAHLQHIMGMNPNFWSLPAEVFDGAFVGGDVCDVGSTIQRVFEIMQTEDTRDSALGCVFFRITNAHPETKVLVELNHIERCRTLANILRYDEVSVDGDKVFLDESSARHCKLDLRKVDASRNS